METEWDVVSQSVLDQLSSGDRALVETTVERAATDWQHADARRLVGAWSGENVFLLRAGEKFRIVVSLEPEKITVLDVVPSGQIDALRRMRGDAA
jgi:hypothetical protein